MTPCWLLVLLSLCSPLCHPGAVEGWGSLSTVPSEKECRPYIEKALKELSPQETLQEAVDTTGSEETPVLAATPDQEGSIEETEQTTATDASDEVTAESTGESTETGEVTNTAATDGVSDEDSGEPAQADASAESVEEKQDMTESEEVSKETEEVKEEGAAEQPSTEDGAESAETAENVDDSTESAPTDEQSTEAQEGTTEQSEEQVKSEEQQSEEQPKSEEVEETQVSAEQGSEPSDEIVEEKSEESEDVTAAEEISGEEKTDETKEVTEESTENTEASEETKASTEDQTGESTESAEITGGEVTDSIEATDSKEETEVTEPAVSTEATESTDTTESTEATESTEPVTAEDTKESVEETIETSKEDTTESKNEDSTEQSSETPATVEEAVKEDSADSTESSGEAATASTESSESTEVKESVAQQDVANETIDATPTSERDQTSAEEANTDASGESAEKEQEVEEETTKEPEPTVEDQLTLEFETPKIRRPRDHITEILGLSPESAETELLLAKTIESTLKELKRLYDAAIKPLEILYKYRDLSNRHFGDPEIFSKPLILFMGPWSGGKSTILNYLLDNEFKSSSLRTGAEPSPAYFNILMGGDREEVLDGTQLAADWTFSGLQKFGQGLLDRLRGLRLNAPLLEKVNIVEIPGILEIRKQVERLFPFNDACQWFIDRADIIFLVYDPSKLDVGPETEAILDQLKGREYQTRIILNKADQVKPEELMRVQGTLIWNISPLMSSQEPPVMYSTSLWSIPYEQGAPSRLLHAQERAFLRDLRLAVDKRVENKIASARRFAVRVRNHAKMVDCYLTTYYNHKSFFGNRKKVADDIIEHPQNYHIYEGLSTLTNISRYDLPDPEVYRDFFRLNNLYDFQRLSDTCTYFRGCPINRLDVAIAYDLPELVGKYKKQAERVLDAVAERAAKSTS